MSDYPTATPPPAKPRRARKSKVAAAPVQNCNPITKYMIPSGFAPGEGGVEFDSTDATVAAFDSTDATVAAFDSTDATVAAFDSTDALMPPPSPAKPPARARRSKPSSLPACDGDSSAMDSRGQIVALADHIDQLTISPANGNENTILHLRVANDSIPEGKVPDPYNEHVDCPMYASASGALDCDASHHTPHHHRQSAQTDRFDKNSSTVVRLLAEFDEKSKNDDWPSNTSIHCYWCCHQFETVPFGLPVKLSRDGRRFLVTGCFCSLECACAYNFDTGGQSDERMTRYNLLNYLSSKLGMGRKVHPAPSWLCLKMFGGNLSIHEFRSFPSSKMVVVNTPPMVTVPQQLEEIHETDTRSEYKYIPLDASRVNKYHEKIKLKRSKPLVNEKNTLDHIMKVRYTSNA